ncbi:hypothetical protein E2R51_01955 [Jeotgalibacillus sp. S-D1]|uniref:sporulation protein YqfD n=1 Tax=Jeotgalibacillus sp. S-D1 TaxID=2552189 RepID=UPI00105996DF|nr:sporulation protein YqfD [Jeotgalibacillus sp. S-D1]TDL34504.1 hypothetical protein E2R51_01955 [Jeotgalibacillus sp. S-D1]
MKPMLPGTVAVTLKGKAYPAVLQRLHQQSVSLHNIRSTGEDEIEFYIDHQSLSSLRKAVFKTGCKIHLKRGEGLVYEIENWFKLRSFILWMIIAIVLVIGSSKFLWSIELVGATPEIQYEVNQALKEQGFSPGRLKTFLPNEEKLAPVLYDQIDKLSWLGMEWQGTKLIVHLKQKQGKNINEKLTPSHIVAAKKGTIQSMLIESGQAVENVNSVVKKGQLIVTGLVGREEEKKAVPSKGVVMAETWYEVNVVIPQQLTREALTGNEETKTSFKIFQWETPQLFWKKPFSESVEQKSVKEYTLLGKDLPVKKQVTHFFETKRSVVKVKQAEAIDIAKKVAREEVAALIGGAGKIENEKILHQQIDNGKVKLTIYFQAIEDIAEVKPFTEETRE